VTVVDASAVLEVLLRTSLAERWTAHMLRPGEVLCAPHLLDVEVPQVLRRHTLAQLRHSLSTYDAAYIALKHKVGFP
jgi:predicted nucleic acid-binding protein